jgi:hypothetical protein
MRTSEFEAEEARVASLVSRTEEVLGSPPSGPVLLRCSRVWQALAALGVSRTGVLRMFIAAVVFDCRLLRCGTARRVRCCCAER